ncbi:hypothetical protein CEUSTIGMA_g12230.t1 [Chlamydomonas eustigma]|uniref:Uncharacterized protein n=1 Tax=Chlamydomonas eustigma TaxID=1157962 RepID=A0A250XPD8_9CHLO|nr:hypothetical protein CEUSTIGMA_g12230.t1 [Chlamydomonas eustigma]|eukprot:GAX84809.1 hypothetical protein CEUSTIGMA_g12230.t1 [Chlamydomonas eustigma]
MQKKKSNAQKIIEHTAPRTKGLQQEAADMEAKLKELKKAMELERARRESMIAAAQSGSMWRNGATGLLRTNFRNKAPSTGSHSTQLLSPSPTTSVNKQDHSHLPSTSSRVVSAPAISRADETLQATSNSSSSSRRGTLLQPSHSPSIGPSEITTLKGTSGVMGVRGHMGGLPGGASISARAQSHSQAQVLSLNEQDGATSGGQGCGHENQDDLSSGAFNEADSYKSFLEALNEWRNTNRGGDASSSTVHQGASMEAQTDSLSGRPPRPMSAPAKKSYFQKFALNTASREAGHSASGKTNSPLSPSETKEFRSSASTPPVAAASSLESKLALLDRLEQLEKEQEERLFEEEGDSTGEKEEIEISTHASKLGLVKGMRLPDAIVVPDMFEESD